MLPNFQAFARESGWGDVAPIRRALDLVWKCAEGWCPSEAEVKAVLRECERCNPESEDFESLYTGAAQDVVSAICAMLEVLQKHSVVKVASVARFSSDTVDLIVQEREDMDPTDPLRERKILEHPLMQQELRRLHRDLAGVAELRTEDIDALRVLRERSRRESNTELEISDDG